MSYDLELEDGTTSRLVISYPPAVGGRETTKPIKQAKTAAAMLCDVNHVQRKDWSGGGHMVGGGHKVARDGALDASYVPKQLLERKRKVRVSSHPSPVAIVSLCS